MRLCVQKIEVWILAQLLLTVLTFFTTLNPVNCIHTLGFVMSLDAILISPTDNVVTLLKNCEQGQEIQFSLNGCVQKVLLKENISFGHKVAITAIEPKQHIIKYGESIGIAKQCISPGEHVHVHNVDSARGRGDVANAEKTSETVESICSSLKLEGTPIVDAKNLTFLGYPRTDGTVGTRNYVAVVSCVVCANDVVSKLGEIEGVAGFTHQQGCSQTKPDIERIKEILINFAHNPNVGAVLYISLGCESVPSKEVLLKARETGKPVELLVIQEEGGASNTIKKAKEIVEVMKSKIAMEPTWHSFSKLKLGLKCGSSDTTQGLSANVIAGKVTDIFVNAGATVVMGETTEFMGAEHIAARRTANQQTANEIIEAVACMEDRARAIGVDMRGGQPTRGNIEGGLTTIEEKSLGALAKSGSAVFQKVINYGERCNDSGLIMMDSPGREPEMLTGLAASGCNLILFTTGRGAPQGFPFVPVIKLTGNSRTWQCLHEHMDSYAGEVMEGKLTYEEKTKEFFKELMDFASGKKTKAEECSYNNSMNIYVTGPTI